MRESDEKEMIKWPLGVAITFYSLLAFAYERLM